ncbi:nucleotide sugar dehydrogenase [bacterium]|nr:nucleotide sugar dehydrogenase [bacterium]
MNRKIKNICCIGAGYVGGPTMAVIADKCLDLNVVVVDMNQKRIDAWNSENLKNLPIYEPGLSQVIQRCRGRNLHFCSDVENTISDADMIFISVNTPTKTKGLGAGQASDLKWIESCSRQIAKHANGHTIVVEKSTLPVKTAQTIKSILEAYTLKDNSNFHGSKSFSILSNPEFLAEGTAINDLIYPDRILIGGEDEEAIFILKEIYLNWVAEEKILTTDLWSSELSKLIANAFLAQRISSINSISALCEVTEANINNVAKAIGMDSRIGEKFLNSGPGFGGSCFKKDISNLIYICNHYGLNEVATYWEQVIKINSWQQDRISRIIVDRLFGTISGKKLTVLGFSFKPNTNDTRESPAIKICQSLLEEGCSLSIYDPKVLNNQIETDLGKFEDCWQKYNDVYEAARGSDAIIILTDWDEFYNLDYAKLYSVMRMPCWIFDTRNIINVKLAESVGFNIWKLGDGSF